MPIVTSLIGGMREEGGQPVLVFTDGERAVGVAVDEILDIVEAVLKVELTAANTGVLGTSVIRDKATEVVDISYHVSEAFSSWFSSRPAKAQKRHVLLIDDSPFFRTMMAPLLAAAGYTVTEAATAETALKFKEEGRSFDLILSDIQMPGMDGRKFASLVKSDPNWKKTPVVGLASDGDDEELGSFDAMAKKFNRDELLSAVRSYIGTEVAAA
jgi:two-component system chemotaxis sensor kinase CheA